MFPALSTDCTLYEYDPSANDGAFRTHVPLVAVTMTVCVTTPIVNVAVTIAPASAVPEKLGVVSVVM